MYVDFYFKQQQKRIIIIITGLKPNIKIAAAT